MKNTINKFLHLKHITGSHRQNILSNSKTLIRFFEKNKQLNSLFYEQYEIDLLNVLINIKQDINIISLKMEELEEELLNK